VKVPPTSTPRIAGQRFPIFYDDPLHSATPSGALNDFGSMPYAATFDSDDNLYVPDLNRDRVFVYPATVQLTAPLRRLG
jgi:hypothetical protein